ncbi:MAG: zf-HC2 domain-containing protein [Clostridia bacterium]|nr:zf-HC2 domain-containing protein [Clostridia bacterium]
MSNQINCKIAQDLMPLVIDNACSEDSRQAVEDHLAECGECRNVFDAMKTETPKLAVDQEENAHFTKAMKKTRFTTRLLKIIAAALAIILAFTVFYYNRHPEEFYSVGTSVPVSWIHDPHLVRTEDGIVLLQFTPDEHYKTYMGFSGLTVRTETAPDGSATLAASARFSYSQMAKLLDSPLPESLAPRNEWIYNLPNGDLALPFSDLYQVCWAGGMLRPMSWRELPAEEAAALAAQIPDAVTAEQISFSGAASNDSFFSAEQLSHFRLEIRDDSRAAVTVYRSGDEIPLCDPELYRDIQIQEPVFLGYSTGGPDYGPDGP